MKKSFLIGILAGLLCLCLTPSAAAENSYSDVPESHWAAENVALATELGLFQGVGGGRFGLGQPISRAAFATAMVRLFGWEAVSPDEPSYSDVPRDSWYYTAVETLLANGAVAASSRTFRPEEELTRSDMASMLMRGLGYTSLAGAAASYGGPFIDVTVNPGFITLSYDLGIMVGQGNGRFNPDGAATREQAATVLVRIHEQLSTPAQPLSGEGGYRVIASPRPLLEPLPELYATLRRMKNNDEDMSRMALRLMAGGVRTVTDASGDPLGASTLISAHEVQEALSREDVTTFYSEKYESAYCIYAPNAYQSATVWYQSDRSMAAKLQLAKLFGVTRYVME